MDWSAKHNTPKHGLSYIKLYIYIHIFTRKSVVCVPYPPAFDEDINEYEFRYITYLSQWLFSGNPVVIQCAWDLNPSIQPKWNVTGEKEMLVASVFPMCPHWSSKGLPVCSNYANYHRIANGTPLGASIRQCGSMASKCNCGSSGHPVFQLWKLQLDCHWKTTER